MMEANAIKVRIGELCHQFRLPTMGAQSVSRFTAAGHGDADPLGSAGAGGRGPEAAPHRPAAHGVQAARRQDLGDLRHDRVPLALRQQLGLSDGSFVDRGVNVLAFGLPGTGKTHAVGHRLVEATLGALRPGLPAGAGPCSPPSGTWRYRDNYESSTTTTSCCWRPGVAPRGRRVRGALHTHRRTRTPVPGSRPPGLLPVGAHLRQPNGHGCPSTGWSTTRSSWNSTSPATAPEWPQRSQKQGVNRQNN